VIHLIFAGRMLHNTVGGVDGIFDRCGNAANSFGVASNADIVSRNVERIAGGFADIGQKRRGRTALRHAAGNEGTQQTQQSEELRRLRSYGSTSSRASRAARGFHRSAH